MERKTKQRGAIKDVFYVEKRPLRAQEILSKARESVEELGLATVYRHLKDLQSEGFINTVELPGNTKLYEKNTVAHHHHYFHCTQCDRYFAVAACPHNLEAMTPGGFVLEDHEIMLSGRCSACAVAMV